MSPPLYSAVSVPRGRSDQPLWQHSTDLYKDRADSRLDFSSYHRGATPPPGNRGAYAPSPPRSYGYEAPTQRNYYDSSSYGSSYIASWAKPKDSYGAAGVPRVGGAAAPSHSPSTGALIPGRGDDGKYTLVFDLDETMCYARAGPARKRPGLQSVLSAARGAEMIVWTAGEKSYAEGAVRTCGASPAHIIARDMRWWREGGSKDLSRLGRDLSRTLLIENTAQCIEKNPEQSLLVPDFTGAAHDTAMPALAQVLSQLLSSGQSVQDFLRESPLLTKRQVRANSTQRLFSAYTLKDHVPDDAVDRAAAQPPPAASYGGGYGSYGAAAYTRPAQPYTQYQQYASSYGSAYS